MVRGVAMHRQSLNFKNNLVALNLFSSKWALYHRIFNVIFSQKLILNFHIYIFN
jgi:hypothetical protein